MNKRIPQGERASARMKRNTPKHEVKRLTQGERVAARMKRNTPNREVKRIPQGERASARIVGKRQDVPHERSRGRRPSGRGREGTA
ncbi:hypothetical protein [Paenibacillus durus]|uniref:Uncharacterized protein n=1 Tax=Paenibacillus durus TaxID=44251 RepID=A0A089HQH4_PAEDU|nr:hypothetical protein [Paenibacillus durus]AIQ14271.1 hypothetical protein PDUR_21960 [Paenibacillus durus]